MCMARPSSARVARRRAWAEGIRPRQDLRHRIPECGVVDPHREPRAEPKLGAPAESSRDFVGLQDGRPVYEQIFGEPSRWIQATARKRREWREEVRPRGPLLDDLEVFLPRLSVVGAATESRIARRPLTHDEVE